MPSEELRNLLRERHRQYQAQHPEAQSAAVQICPDCSQPTYSAELCPVTGKYHNMAQKTIVGGSIVQGRIVNSSQLMEAIERTRVKWVASRTQLVKADSQSLHLFQSYVAGMDWKLQRYGILYGLYDAESHTVEVHAIYEPEQQGNAHTFQFRPDPRLAKVDTIATALGLRRVGAVCTHPARDPDVIILNAREMLLCAREQSLYGDECVLLTLAPSLARESNTDEMAQERSAAARAAGVVECQAWQVSPQCVNLYRLGVLQEPEQDALIEPEQARLVRSTIELEEAQQISDAKGRPSVITKAPSKSIDTRWFTSYIAVQHFNSNVVHNLFMRIARPGMSSPTFQNLRSYMHSAKRKGETFAQKLADFHVLIFLAEQLSMKDDMPILVQIAKTKTMSKRAQQYEELLEARMQQG